MSVLLALPELWGLGCYNHTSFPQRRYGDPAGMSRRIKELEEELNRMVRLLFGTS